MKKYVAAVTLAILAAHPAFAQPAYTQGNDPVTLSAIDDLDPCSYGVIADQGPEGAVNVYSGPSLELEPVDYISGGQAVWICESSNDDSMIGIVYTFDDNMDCGVSSPVAEDTDYFGPCQSGWIVADAAEMQAG
ncbi:hypothetical protein ACFOWX_11315 [Sphingorhabdus arenilitoris]|uniref:Integron n=1 Tax=Sphingorhabdus arenilitoris TaxID=1490041 RepID=A0ABV8RJA7_9SPHN